uniref:Uncharacterized protein n=1 Tax=Chromera velia CCMP2878 TaxID=1169474 RepID=A0A0G4F5S7_9ALVE|eukprot:Cvel_15331.t1-p1 / transcript=Cvel_15331.t1 / gene=Cvel_15331 / organism=Chromera_velia_CCMP2878 / gene_product=hypothetical protein / transcript_product=hypothetical protein / location=Cvel_scaffold1127:42554-43341(-) / protein_length=110 / sequence_SO=supercontig / SO=protein_coding / is_pseudo=false
MADGTGREITPVHKDQFWKACVANELTAGARWAAQWGEVLTPPERRLVSDVDLQRDIVEKTLKSLKDTGARDFTIPDSEMRSELRPRPPLELFGVSQNGRKTSSELQASW